VLKQYKLKEYPVKQIVGVADMKVSNNSKESIITYSLGSCIGLVVYDPIARVGGMLHYMLPESSIDKNKAEQRHYMFADSGIPRLIKEAYKLGAVKQRIVQSGILMTIAVQLIISYLVKAI
jgi:chemotaxis protein CheD